jgi:hypothetical protein
MEKIDKIVKQKKIQELFKLCKLQRTKPEQIDFILKKFNIDILTVYNRVGGLTLFQYTVYTIFYTNPRIEILDYLYNNGGYSENDFQYCRTIDTMNWFLEKKLIKPTITITYKYKDNYGVKKVEYHNMNTIVFLLASGLRCNSWNGEYKSIYFNWIKQNLDIYQKDENNNSILDLFKHPSIYNNNNYDQIHLFETKLDLLKDEQRLPTDNINMKLLQNDICDRNNYVVKMLKNAGVTSKFD